MATKLHSTKPMTNWIANAICLVVVVRQDVES